MPKSQSKPKPAFRVFRIQYLNEDGLRCTTFLNTITPITVEDVTDKTKEWKKIKLVKPDKAALDWAADVLASSRMVPVIDHSKPCLSPKCEAGYETCRNCKDRKSRKSRA